MKRMTITLGATMTACAAIAADLYVGDGDVVTNHVTAGESSTQSGKIAVSAGGELRKTGGGTWTVPSSAVAQHWPLEIKAVNGTVQKTAASGATENPVPEVVRRSALWLSAKDSEHVVRNGDSVTAWYDVRETNTAAPVYLRATANNEKTTDNPTFEVKDGFESIYFGGVGSGQAMTIKSANNAVYKIPTYHIFGVVGYYQTQGCVFGSGGTGGTSEIPLMYYIDPNKRISTSYCDPVRKWLWTSRARIYVDGKRCDPYKDIPQAGKFNLLDAGSPEKNKYVTGFFNMWSSKENWGGDYLSEVLVFTNNLSEVERLQVSAYLSKKWFATAEQTSICVGKNATAVLGADSSSADGAAVVLSGDGTVVKNTADTFRYRSPEPFADKSFDGALVLENGSIDLSTRLPIKVESGSTVSTEVTVAGDLRTSIGAAAPDTLIKEGTGSVAIVSMPAGLKKLTVSAGKLDIVSKTVDTLQPEEDDEVYIENPSFEDFADDEALIADGGGFAITSPGSNVYTYYRGWRRQVNAARVFNWERWTGTSKVWGNTRAAYAFNHHPLGGACAVGLAQNCVLATPVTISKTGTYELTFDMSARESASYYGYYVTCSLWDRDTNAEVMQFGRGYFYELDYHPTALRGLVSKTGNFELRIRAQNIHSDRFVVVDNFRLRRVTDIETGRYDMPNGDFETGDLSFEAATAEKITESPYSNWVFNQDQGEVGIVTLPVTNWNGSASEVRTEYNDSRKPYGGFRQLLLRKGPCSVDVTGTPTAGTYYLRADLGKYAQYRGTLTASAVVGGGQAVELGSFVVSNTVMRTYTWPKAFTVNGSQTVKITFAFSRNQSSTSTSTGIWLDDVRLGTYDDRELLVNGNFEGGVAGGNWAATGWDKRPGTASVYPYTWQTYYFCGDNIDGRYYLYVERDCGAEQDVTFDHAGRYRLSFYTACSTSAYNPERRWYRNFSPVSAWIAKDGITNVIGVTEHVRTTNFVQQVWTFDVANAGTYRFGIQGTSTNTDQAANACIDAVSIRRVDTSRITETAPEFDEQTVVRVDSGARMRMSFDGTKTVRKIVLGGKSVGYGEIDIADYPEFFEGKGRFNVVPNGGLSIIFK